MKLIKFIGIAILVAVVSIATYLGYYGYFSEISFDEQVLPDEVLVYEAMQGDYKKSKVVMDKVYNELLNDFGIETKRGFGIYYDNPKIVEEENLRSEIGCLLPSIVQQKKDSVGSAFSVKEFKGRRAIVAKFPFKGGGSILVGIMKVYPKMSEILKQKGFENGLPVMEVYDVPNKTIEYRALLPE